MGLFFGWLVWGFLDNFFNWNIVDTQRYIGFTPQRQLCMSLVHHQRGYHRSARTAVSSPMTIFPVLYLFRDEMFSFSLARFCEMSCFLKQRSNIPLSNGSPTGIPLERQLPWSDAKKRNRIEAEPNQPRSWPYSATGTLIRNISNMRVDTTDSGQ